MKTNELAEEEIFKMVLKSDLDFKTAPWPSVSDAAKDCVKQLLNRNASQRATAAEVLNHPWLTQQGLQSDRPLDNVVIQRMRQVCHHPALPQSSLPGSTRACQLAMDAKESEMFAASELQCTSCCSHAAMMFGPSYLTDTKSSAADCYKHLLLPHHAELL